MPQVFFDILMLILCVGVSFLTTIAEKCNVFADVCIN